MNLKEQFKELEKRYNCFKVMMSYTTLRYKSGWSDYVEEGMYGINEFNERPNPHAFIGFFVHVGIEGLQGKPLTHLIP